MANQIEVKIPDIGGASDVEVIEVSVNVGDKVSQEASLITLESDKAAMDIPSPQAGVVTAIKLKAGDKVSEGSLILTLEVDDQSSQSDQAGDGSVKASPQQQVATPAVDKQTASQMTHQPLAATPQSSQPSSSQPSSVSLSGDIYAGPAVRRLANELDLDLSQIKGSGNKGRITKADVQSYVKSRMQGGGIGLPLAPQVDFSQFGEIESLPLTRINKLTGKNMQRNWLSVPHVSQFEQADITEMEAFRQANKMTAEKQGFKLTPLVFIMKAAVAALKQYPRFNASLDSSGESLILKKYFHIGIAVDTPNGLVVPVIRDVEQKGFLQLAKELAEISIKARDGKLTANNMKGGCFTISSLGGIGGTAFTPIVNAPEVAILGVSKSSIEAVYNGETFEPRLMLPLSLSYDHRVIDGALGARFTVYLAQCLSDLRKLLL